MPAALMENGQHKQKRETRQVLFMTALQTIAAFLKQPRRMVPTYSEVYFTKYIE